MSYSLSPYNLENDIKRVTKLNIVTLEVRGNIFRVGVSTWQVKPCTTQSYEVTDNMRIQRELQWRKKNGIGMQKEAKTESIEHQERRKKLQLFTLLNASHGGSYTLFSVLGHWWDCSFNNRETGLFTIDNGTLDKHKKKTLLSKMLYHMGKCSWILVKEQNKKIIMHNNTSCLHA